MNSNHMYISEAFQDLGNLISILTNDAISATIEDISIILSIPVFRVREMIIQLSQFKELNGALVVEPVISSDENNFFSSDSDSDPDFPSNIRAGYYDQQAFRLILREDAFISHNQFLFQCDNLEYRMLTSEYPELKKSISSQPYYMVKESPFTPPIENKRITNLLEVINQAIEFKLPISMQYYSPTIRQKEEKIFYPVFIYYNIASSSIYCIDGFRSNDGARNAYRLDRILHADIVTSPKCLQCSYTPLTEDEQQKLYCFWGAPDFYPKASNEHNEQFHVKLKIFNETANLLKKIQSETANRKYGKLYQEGDTYFYEDDVIGKDSFRSWLRSYGSSVLVLEPLSLAKEIYEMERRKLEVFEKGDFLDL
mgnify:FL=1